MKIGVHLAGFTPDVGGGYTFQTDVFAAFAAKAGERADTFVILCDSPAILDSVRRMALPANCQTMLMPPQNIASRLARWMTALVPQTRRYVGRFGHLQQSVTKEHIEFLWHVGGGPQELADVPYIATVWDIQHRTHPWLPEVSGNGLWESREAAHASFLARATYVITGTETGVRELELFYRIPRKQIRILPHPTPAFALDAANSSVSNVRERYSLQNDFYIYPAQFWPHKNHINLLHALAKLKQDYAYRPSMILMGSDKGAKSFVLAQARALGIETQLVFPGFVPVPDLVALYREAAGLVYLSMSGPENLPPLEAFALRCPVLASDIPGAREQLADNALLVPPYEPAAIAKAWYQLKFDSQLRERLKTSGLARAKKWTAHEYVAGVFGIFDEFAPVRRCWL